MRIGICDDERNVREILGEKVKRLYPEAELLFYASGEEVLKGETAPDILFLDIQMPGADGIETAKRLREREQKTILIFVTALEEYVFQAFDVRAFHYLVKPVTEEKFCFVLQEAVQEYGQRVCEEKEKRRTEREDSVQQERYLLVKNGGTCSRVFFKDIVYAEVFNRKITLYKTDGKIEYYGRMSDLEKQAGTDFFRPHRAYLVHFRYVEKYTASVIYLENGKEVLMAKKRFSAFVKAYLQYNQRKGETAWKYITE